MDTIKPIRRSLQLQPLSREHHDGLLFVWKIRQGLANKTSVQTLRSFTGWYWKEHIRPHFFQEEKVLLPYMPPGNELAQRVVKEHEAIRELVISVDKDPDAFDLERLAGLIESHIRFEEREMFGYLESMLTQEELNAIAVKLNDHPVCPANEWREAFWERNKI